MTELTFLFRAIKLPRNWPEVYGTCSAAHTVNFVSTAIIMNPWAHVASIPICSLSIPLNVNMLSLPVELSYGGASI